MFFSAIEHFIRSRLQKKRGVYTFTRIYTLYNCFIKCLGLIGNNNNNNKTKRKTKTNYIHKLKFAVSPQTSHVCPSSMCLRVSLYLQNQHPPWNLIQLILAYLRKVVPESQLKTPLKIIYIWVMCYETLYLQVLKNRAKQMYHNIAL